MARNWWVKKKETNTKIDWVSYIQCYFKLPHNSVEKRSFKELQRQVASDIVEKYGKVEARKIFGDKLKTI